MKKTVWTFGLISGAIFAVMMAATVPFADRIGFDKGYILGYTTIVAGALMIFFGIRSYRENASGGRLTFGRGFAVGILISLVSSVCYTAAGEVIYSKFMPDFPDKYAAYMIEKVKASGASQAEIDKKTKEAKDFRRMYDNPAWRLPMTFAEVFPVELVVTLLSAAILRKKATAQAT